MKRLIFLVILLILLVVAVQYRSQLVFFFEEKVRQRSLPSVTSISPMSSVIPSPILSPQVEEEKGGGTSAQSTSQSASSAIPLEFNLAVPFTSQAPTQNWNLPYKEACEEAAVLMVDAFYKGYKLTKRSSDKAIKELVEWQKKIFGDYKHTTAEQTARILREYYGYKNVKVTYDPTLEDIKRQVAQGRPVILPAAGRLLGNRYFRQPGPLYHMLVVRGWTKDGLIITNDPGTKRGEGYLYKPEVLMKAIHDWNEGDVYNGRRVMIVVES